MRVVHEKALNQVHAKVSSTLPGKIPEHLVEQLSQLIQSCVKHESNLELVTEEPKAEPGESKQAISFNLGQQDQQQGSQHENQWLLGKWLLNTQQEGAVAHKYTTIPLWFGDRYVEVDVALFSQREAFQDPKGSKHQRLVFSLESEQLGQIDISAIVADRHISMQVSTDSESSAEQIAEHLPQLKQSLSTNDWLLDSIRYQALSHSEMNPVLKTVVEHQIRQDSLNQLF